MTDNGEHSRHVSYEQLKCILDFMGQHVEFATGSLRTLEARHTSKRLWHELTNMLNNCQGGTMKTADGWSKYWSDFKNKLKNKAWLLKRERAGDSLKNVKALTKMEMRALVILGPYFNKRKSKSRYSETSQDLLTPEVKMETTLEVETDEDNKLHDETDRLSDCDERSNSGESSGGQYVDDNESNDAILKDLYPKWLIDVEKKRADAELIRAKAEEQRAVVAAKSSEAALVQAEALKRLAEAATLQADALARIATVLERGQRDILDI